MLKGSHKLALLVGVAIFLGLFRAEMVPGPWKDKAHAMQENEAHAAFLKASNLKPQHLRARSKPKPDRTSGWWIF